VFRRAFASAPWTMPAVASMLTGQPASVHGAFGHLDKVRPIAADVPMLAETLQQHGYVTGAIVNAPFLAPAFGFARGFGTYDYEPATNRRLRRAGPSVDKALAWLRGVPADRPAFLLLHLFDPHAAYDPPSPWGEAWTAGYRGKLRRPLNPVHGIRRGRFHPDAEDLRFMRGLYDGEVAYTDDALGTFFARLEQVRPHHGRWILVTADHGEELGDHGGFEHGHTMYRELTQVPLLLVPPGGCRQPVVDVQVRTLDVMPTLLAAAGASPPAGIAGRSLASLCRESAASRDRLAISEHEHLGRPSAALRDGAYALIQWEGGAAELYDEHADPAELHDLAAAQPERAGSMAALLRRTQAGLARLGARHGAGGAAAPLDPQLAAELRSLGYLGP